MNLSLPCWIWNCRSEFEFAVVNLNLPWWIWICLGEFEFAVVNLNLLWWIWICRGEFEFIVVNLKLPQWIWICSCEFEFVMVSLKFAATHKCHDKTLNSFRNTLLFGAKFLIICLISAAKFLPHGKTFFLKTKFLTKAKLPFSWQTFESKANLSFWWQNFFTAAKLFIQSVYNLRGGLLERMTGQQVRLFYRSYFSRSLPVLGHIFQPFCKLKVPFKFHSSLSHSLSFVYSKAIKRKLYVCSKNEALGRQKLDNCCTALGESLSVEPVRSFN